MSNSSIIEKKKKLYTWNEGQKWEFIKKKGVPRNIETLLIERLGEVSPEGSPIKSPGKWSGWSRIRHSYPPTGEYAFPKEIFFEVPANNSVTFDFIGKEHNTRIVSEEMFDFLKEHGLEKYEIAKANVINRKGLPIKTKKQYFVLWFYEFDDEFLEFGDMVKVTQESIMGMKPLSYELYPNMQVKHGVNKKIFNLKHLAFNEGFIFTSEIKDLIEKRGFIGPNIYAMDELWKAYVDEKPI